jgi:hypothetical protein
MITDKRCSVELSVQETVVRERTVRQHLTYKQLVIFGALFDEADADCTLQDRLAPV